jgi:hypothetical protein
MSPIEILAFLPTFRNMQRKALVKTAIIGKDCLAYDSNLRISPASALSIKSRQGDGAYMRLIDLCFI